MYFVYLQVDKQNKIYIGYTSDLDRRTSEHYAGKVYTTSRMDEPRLFYYEAYLDEAAAKLRERKLKQYGSSYHGLLKRLNLK